MHCSQREHAIYLVLMVFLNIFLNIIEISLN